MPQHLHYIVATTTQGDRVEVTLVGNAANVLLLDDAAYAAYSIGRAYTYLGGYFTHTPAIITPPPGRWHVVVDLGGGGGRVNASVTVRPAPNLFGP